MPSIIAAPFTSGLSVRSNGGSVCNDLGGAPGCCGGTPGIPCEFIYGTPCTVCVGSGGCGLVTGIPFRRVCVRNGVGQPLNCTTTFGAPISFCCGDLAGAPYSASGNTRYSLSWCPNATYTATFNKSGTVGPGGVVTGVSRTAYENSGPPNCTLNGGTQPNGFIQSVRCDIGGWPLLQLLSASSFYPIDPLLADWETVFTIEIFIPGSFHSYAALSTGTVTGLSQQQTLYMQEAWGRSPTCTRGPQCEPRGACCCRGGCFSWLTPSECAAGQGTWLGENSICEDEACSFGCCIPEMGCLRIPRDVCALFGGLYNPQCANPCPRFGACCDIPTGLCQGTVPEACQAPNIFHGLGSTCLTLPRPGCPQPTGRCCIPNGSGGYSCQGNRTAAECAALNGVWGGYNSNCSGSPCPPATGGACCLPNGGCQQVNNPQACIDLNGTFFSGGDCQAVQCTGSCCTNGKCSMVSQQACLLGGGTFIGGLSCNPDPCNVEGACCCPSSQGPQCGVTTQTACLAGAGCTFLGPGTSCDPFPCGGGTTEAPFLPIASFNRGFSRPFTSPIVLRDGSPASSLGTIRTGGCAGCGGEKGERV
jgi:hypothetical protein